MQRLSTATALVLLHAMALCASAQTLQNKPGVHQIASGEAGFYRIADSMAQLKDAHQEPVQLRVTSRHADKDSILPAVYGVLNTTDPFEFNTLVGYLDAGDTVKVELSKENLATIEYKLVHTPAIPVAEFPSDIVKNAPFDAPGAWSLMANVDSSRASRVLAWNNPANASKNIFALGDSSAKINLSDPDKSAVVAFRVPHSGYYALHNAWAQGPDVTARIFVGRSAETPLRTLALSDARSSLNSDLGYVQKGDDIYIALSAKTAANVELAANIIEWAPRRAPLRVHRAANGYLNVYDPSAPRTAIEIPADRWITVPASEGDATDAIRAAIQKVKNVQTEGQYVGIRLQRGKRYIVATGQAGGVIFDIRDMNHFVFDGNGATLVVNSAESPRTGIKLFEINTSRSIVFADMTVDSLTPPPYTLGEIVAVSPMEKGNQTVTFKLLPGMPDPLADISRTGITDGYAYDPITPGRLQKNAWGHYPGATSVKPQLRPGKEPGLFEHTVTRTNESIRVGSKWLVKNKKAGVSYLTTRQGSEDITLSGIDARACGGGLLRFWDSSGINILSCRYQPIDDQWIGSSSDGIHGRARDGVWVEDTLLRGVCEDIMNTYGVSLVVMPDDHPNDDTITLRIYSRDRDPWSPPNNSALVGDELIFFDPQTGRVLGYADILDITPTGQAKLSRPVPDIVTWKKGSGVRATMVYSTRLAANVYVRDSKFMDSLRFGIYTKANQTVVFNTQFEGLTEAPIYAANEPEWPEGPPPTSLWLQGNTFTQNGFGYCTLNRRFLTVDPANISIYTRKLRESGQSETLDSNIVHGQYANSHVRIIDNFFDQWRGMGIAIRNARNVAVSGNTFFPPTDDALMRKTLSQDPTLARNGTGRYAGIFLSDVAGATVTHNRFIGLPSNDFTLMHQSSVAGATESDNNRVDPPAATAPTVSLPFAEWTGATSDEATGIGQVADHLEIHGATHPVGRFGAGLHFSGADQLAILRASSDFNGPTSKLSVALWVSPEETTQSQIIYSQGDRTTGLIIQIQSGRYIGSIWNGSDFAQCDMGPAIIGIWQHLLLTYDGDTRSLRSYTDGIQLAQSTTAPATISTSGDATLGGILTATRLNPTTLIKPGNAPFKGMIDEFNLYRKTIDSSEAAYLAQIIR